MKTKRLSLARILTFPGGQSPGGGRLDALHIQVNGRVHDLIMDYRELQMTSPPILKQSEGKLWERVEGVHIPQRMCFQDAQIIDGEALSDHIQSLPDDDPSRSLTNAIAWRTSAGVNYFLFTVRTEAHPRLLFTSQSCTTQERLGPIVPVRLKRDWSPPPASPGRLVPNPILLHERYGGNPIAIHIHGRIQLRQLFIGGVDIQGKERPDVQVVLNVGEEPSRWTEFSPSYPTDRWENKGEGSKGMDIQEITKEARWVINHLQTGQKVLVHCAAGMNRSATICCAVIVLLEGLSAENALDRVREHHPWACPDPHHWLALKCLANS